MSFITCTHCQETVTPKNKLFDAQKLSSLSLKSVNNFWANDSIKYVSDYMGAYFDSHKEFIEGIRYSGKIKAIIVSVFKSQNSAIDAMELRRNNVAKLFCPVKSTMLLKANGGLVMEFLMLLLLINGIQL